MNRVLLRACVVLAVLSCAATIVTAINPVWLPSVYIVDAFFISTVLLWLWRTKGVMTNQEDDERSI